MREVAPGVYPIEGLKTGRSYLIENQGSLTLIDTSSPSAASRIIRAIEEIGRRPEDLRLIVATHYHYDHTGNVAALRERTGAQFAAHVEEAPYIDGRTPWRYVAIGPVKMDLPERRRYALAVDRELADGEVLPAAGGLEVIHTPGHTPGHIALYARERGALFAGDAFANWFGLQLPLRMSSHDMEQAKQSVARLARLDYDVALPGHGNPIVGLASEKVAEWSRRWLWPATAASG